MAELAIWAEDPKVQQELARRADDPEVYEDGALPTTCRLPSCQ